MKGTDWGKLVARAVAVIFFITGASHAVTFFEVFKQSRFDAWTFAHILVFWIGGVAVWFASAKFAPSELADEESPLAPIFVAAFASYFFLSYSYSVVEFLVLRLRTEPGALPPPLVPLLFDLFVVLGCAFLMVNAKSVVRWVAR
jgi:hypothetical protein